MRFTLTLFLICSFLSGYAQKISLPENADSVLVRVHPSYDKKGKFHRWLFGENYRKEWNAETKLPVIHLSEIGGGLTPLQLGGGMQSKSLRLKDKQDKEWVIRSVEKNPDALLPEALRETFARDWVDDATSAQHPFSALIVPPIANAVKVLHSVPIIGVVDSDTILGIHSATFSNMVVLMEEREPLGESDNTEKMKRNLSNDNDNTLDGKQMLRARLLDMLIGDWDRHEDQWRWYDTAKGKDKVYLAVPRDRDQVFHLTQGIIPRIVSREYILPTLRSFDKRISRPQWVAFKTHFVNAYPSFQLSREEWMETTRKFQQAVTDSVLEEALNRLPESSYILRHDQLLEKLKARRENLPSAINAYYSFIQKVADIQLTHKSELVEITGENNDLNVRIFKINKKGNVSDKLMSKTYDASLTKELRIYLRNGNDSVIIKNNSSAIKIRLIGGEEKKLYHIVSSKNKIHLYDTKNGSAYLGDVSKLKKHFSSDSLQTAVTPVNLYNTLMPLVWFGVNRDDGFILGAGFKYIRQEGFRKYPYASMHQLTAGHSFSTGAFKIKYNSEWIDAIGKTDITMQALVKAPDNTTNFFGRGNETEFNKTGNFITFYRTRFSTYQFDPAFRWRKGTTSAFGLGPSLYYYTFDKDDNTGRFINTTSKIGSYDSLLVDKNKLHLGIAAQYLLDTRKFKLLPQQGAFLSIRLQGYKGVGKYAKDFVQLIPEFAFYKKLNTKASIILAERFGGTISVGDPGFYQSAFIGGHENLLGYRQYRFAGQHSLYNNLELRVKLADIANYLLPGQFGVTGFWDVGRVWEKYDNSGKLHHGVGGGIYFAPASMFAFNLVVGYSEEGWLPYFTMGLRF